MSCMLQQTRSVGEPFVTAARRRGEDDASQTVEFCYSKNGDGGAGRHIPELFSGDRSHMATWHVILLGLIEGLTEVIPVSSTGHLLLAGYFLGFQSPGKTFEVLIQLGAILAILTVYSGYLLRLLFDLPRDARARRFVLSVLLAFLPAA